MPETIPMGRKSLFLPLNPSEIVQGGEHAELVCKNGSVATIVRFPQAMLLQLPTETRCATVSGETTLELRINDDAFVEGTEIVIVDELDVFDDLPTENREVEEIPF